MGTFRTGHVSIIGRPNVGKSTLLNHMLEQKLGIVSRKPQTTRWIMKGIKTTADAQIIFIDTPGLQKKPRFALNRYMNREVINSLDDIDMILFLIEANKWNEADDNVLTTLNNIAKEKIIVLINKIDKLNDKTALLTFINTIADKTGLSEILPISAKQEEGLDVLEKTIIKKLPEATALYPEDQLSNRSERFFAAEFIREKLIACLGDELPYQLSITIDEFAVNNHITHIHACIWVEKKGQKSIVIGKQGRVLKSVGQAARKDLEALLDSKVNLKTWVKVKANWSDSEQALKQLGYNNEG